MADERLREADHPLRHVGGGHQLADQQEERDGEQALGVDAVEELADDRWEADRREQRANENARDQRECHRHAHVAEAEEQRAHEADDGAVAHVTTGTTMSASSGPAKPRRQPFTSCSTAKRAMNAPEMGTMIV